jgi:RimJ/RimL family protein N-acetyltransferase
MVADPEQMRFYPRPKTRDEARSWIEWNLGLYAEHGFGTWLLEASDGAFAGYCGIRPLRLDGRDERELAWHVRKDYWNRGVATAAARAAIDRGRSEFALSRLVAIIHPANAPSRRVAEKLGLAIEGETTVDGEPVVVYATTPARFPCSCDEVSGIRRPIGKNEDGEPRTSIIPGRGALHIDIPALGPSPVRETRNRRGASRAARSGSGT